MNLIKLPSCELHGIKGTELLIKLHAVISAIGKDSLGFSPNDISLHSLRSGAAMAMYLIAVPVFTIMLIGRWSSDASLRYIRRQAKGFSNGISTKMITHEAFFTIPEISRYDPRILGHHLNHRL
jgi:hypothetical protein